MKLIIAGSSSLQNYNDVVKGFQFNIDNFIGKVDEVVIAGEYVKGSSGKVKPSSGGHTIAYDFAVANKYKVKIFPADFVQKSRSAGLLRNQEMINYAKALLFAWDGISLGIYDLIRKAHKAELKVYGFTLLEEKPKNPIVFKRGS